MSQDTRIGSVIAGYRIERLLGRGGMGVVYLAEQAFPKRKAALKLLAPELAEDQAFRDRFIRESNAAASLDHSNVIPIYGAGEEDGVLYIAMRYVEGEDLAKIIEAEGGLPPERAVRICSQVAEALDAAHDIGLIHRDVKPGNILVGKGDHAYLTDFGLIRRRDATSGLTRTGQFMGSIDYAAPEQIKGEPVDGRADVYSLGCVLFECLAGEPPFPRDSEVAVLYSHLNDPPPKVTGKRPELPQAIDRVMVKAMAKVREDRYAAAGELAAAAGQALHEPIGGPQPSTPRQRRRAMALAGLAAVLVAGAVLLALTLTSHRTPPRPSTTSGPGSALPPTNSVIEIDPTTNKIVATVRDIGIDERSNTQQSLAVGEGGVWVLTFGNLVHIDEDTARVDDVLPILFVGGGTNSVVVSFHRVWINDTRSPPASSRLVSIDPATNEFLRPVILSQGGQSADVVPTANLVIGAGAVWVPVAEGSVIRVNGVTGRISGTIAVDGQGSLDAAAFGEGALWLASRVTSTVWRVDPRTGNVSTIPFTGNLEQIVAGEGAVWILDGRVGAVTPIETATNTVGAPLRVGNAPTAMAVGLGAVWVADKSGRIYRIDPDTHDVSEIRVGRPVLAVAVDEKAGTLWAAI